MDVRPWQFIKAMVTGWLCRGQQSVIEYLVEAVPPDALGRDGCVRLFHFVDQERMP